jgi:hypothetical protein
MKIILSRKGFDSSSGGVPSPILPSGELVSLPIPSRDEQFRRYKDIKLGDGSLGPVVKDLTRGRVRPDDFTHLDPDLDAKSVSRIGEQWRPIFGQSGSAQSHLQNNGIKVGDLFLFYGWFRKVEIVEGVYKYVQGSPDLHVIFGWLQIEQCISVHNQGAIPSWARDHQHVIRMGYAHKTTQNDSIYISTERLELPQLTTERAGGGRFEKFDRRLCLTAPNEGRSTWQLPGCFAPWGKNTLLSYHKDLRRWTGGDGYVLLKSVGRGQEFVLDCDEYPEAIEWLSDILKLAD